VNWCDRTITAASTAAAAACPPPTRRARPQRSAIPHSHRQPRWRRTTTSIESLNYQLRKIIKNRGHFPNDDAVIKLLWLAICSIEDKRARDRAKEAGLGRRAKRKAEGHLVEGQTTTSWKQALAQLTLIYPDRINPYL
jgi:hypothetical protein